MSTPDLLFEFDPFKNKSEDIWHCRIAEDKIAGANYYSFQASSSPTVTGEGTLFKSGKELLDPYATQVFFPPGFNLASGSWIGGNAGEAALAVLPHKQEQPFDWGDDAWPFRGADLLIYEMHVCGFTRNLNSGVAPERAGGYLGVIDKIPHLQQLGVTAVELMPVFCFEPHGQNYWGYMPLNFFYPHPTYASRPERAIDEFRQMVKALHDVGIEVILDVVFNHSAEAGTAGPNIGMKGLDNTSYYLTLGDPPSSYDNFSGTGNTLDPANRPMRRLVLDSLRYWVKEMHVDGFRFDLASVFARNADGSLNTGDPPIFAEMAADPDLADIRLIAEPWDASNGYLLGRSFPGLNWLQWNGRYRDDIRRFVRGDQGLVGSIMTRIYGSDDLFPGDAVNARHPYQSVNYIDSHDGFTLYDIVAYSAKHNEANGENNTDGPKENFSWNCGYEGDVGVPPEVRRLRKQQARNLFTLLMLSNGTPMIRMGDEFLQTQGGNSNPWNQDNPTSWLDWDRCRAHDDFFQFVRSLIAFRNAHPAICRSRFWRDDIHWLGVAGSPDLSTSSQSFAFGLQGASQGDTDLYVMINMSSVDIGFTVQYPGEWRRMIDTSSEVVSSIAEADRMVEQNATQIVCARSIVILIRV